MKCWRVAEAVRLAGFIIGGAIRAHDEIANHGGPVVARANTPAGPHKMGPHRQKVPVALGGQRVPSGDVIAADADVLVVIPSTNWFQSSSPPRRLGPMKRRRGSHRVAT